MEKCAYLAIMSPVRKFSEVCRAPINSNVLSKVSQGKQSLKDGAEEVRSSSYVNQPFWYALSYQATSSTVDPESRPKSLAN